MNTTKQQSERIIRLSFSWVVLSLVIVLLFGALGGVIAQQVWQPKLPPLTSDTGQLITTVQEVTISPNTAAVQLVENSHRSVVLLGQAVGGEKSVVATALVVTNDGLLVTSTDVPSGQMVVHNHEGSSIAIDFVGRDELFGLTYFRIPSGVFVPLELQAAEVPVASRLLVLSRSAQTLQPLAHPFDVSEHIVPNAPLPKGIQRLLKGTPVLDSVMAGSPLLDDEGKVVALLINGPQGLALPASYLRESSDRIINNQRERDPMDEAGLTLTYSFADTGEPPQRQFVVQVQAVRFGSPAAIAGVSPGDIIIKAGDDIIDWNTSIVERLSQPLPLSLTVRRQGEEHVLTLQDVERSP